VKALSPSLIIFIYVLVLGISLKQVIPNRIIIKFSNMYRSTNVNRSLTLQRIKLSINFYHVLHLFSALTCSIVQLQILCVHVK